MISEAATVIDSAGIQQVNVSAYKIPTDLPEADGTLSWNSTTLVLVQITAAGHIGIGYTYADESAAFFIENNLKQLIIGKNALDVQGITGFLTQQIRNSGSTGIAMMAISAIDNALWDLKAKIYDTPLCKLIGQAKDSMLIYGSGGFTSYDKQTLQSQFSNWSDKGISYMKMKVGAQPADDLIRMQHVRESVDKDVQLMIDANGAYNIKQALMIAEQSVAFGVTWFEEPVSSDNINGLSFIRQHSPSPINVAAGEYGYDLSYFEAMLSAKAVDVLQADATRCGGISGFLKAGYLAEAHQLPFSSHCAPALHLHAAVALPSFFIAEYFHDHVRIENMLFEGTANPKNGMIKPDLSRAGLGIAFKQEDAKKYKL